MSVNVVNKSTGALTKVAGNAITKASGINYSHTTSGMSATNVQDAIDESYGELKSGLINVESKIDDATTYPYADVITIEDAIPANVADCSVKIDPIQDLHGQSAPYVGGAGKNKLPMTVAGLKAANTTGTWSGNAHTVNGVTFDILTDDGENVIGIKTTGTASADMSFVLCDIDKSAGSFVYNGCTGGSGKTYYLDFYGNGGSTYKTNYSGDTPFKLEASKRLRFRIIFKNGYECPTAGLMFYPMIRLATETDATFAPYTNICPISGHTESVVTVERPNLLVDADWVDNKYITQDGSIGNMEGMYRYTDNYIDVSGNTLYAIHEHQNVATNLAMAVAYYDSGKTFIRRDIVVETSGVSDYTAQFTTPANCRYVRANVALQSNDVMMQEGVFGHETYTIALGDTIYGGTVDFDSGVMTVTHKYVEFSGGETETWTSASDRPHSFSHAENLGIVDAWSRTDITMISNQFIQNGEVAYYGSNYRIGYTNSGTLYVGMPNIDNVADFKTYLSNNHLQIVGTLATPFTVQLTPQQIQLLKGTNTLYASTGDISVTVNGVSGSIGSVQEQANATDAVLAELAADIAEQLPTAPTTDGAYVLTVTVADGTPTYSWVSTT